MVKHKVTIRETWHMVCFSLCYNTKVPHM